MSDLQFNISARDQASRVVAEVQKKVTEFGKDIGRSIVAVVGPMALLQAGFSAISSHLEDMKRKAADAFKWGAGLGENAAKLGLTVEQFQKVTAAASSTGSSVEDVAKAYKLANDLLAQAKAGNKDAAASLEALGLGLEDIKTLTPETILENLARALSQVEDPADRAKVAVGALGEKAKDLQDTLAKGFKISDVFKGLEEQGVLSTEEADFLRRQAAQDMRDQAKAAKEQVTQRFLETQDPGRAIMQREAEDAARRRTSMVASGMGINPLMTPAGRAARSAEEMSKDPLVQAEVLRILKEQATAGRVAEANRPITGTAPNVGGLINLGRDRLEPPKPPKPEAPEKAAGITVSSLRSLGGGVAGENLFVEQNVPKAQLAALESIDKNIKTLVAGKSPDLTKPPSGAPGSGLASNN